MRAVAQGHCESGMTGQKTLPRLLQGGCGADQKSTIGGWGVPIFEGAQFSYSSFSARPSLPGHVAVRPHQRLGRFIHVMSFHVPQLPTAKSRFRLNGVGLRGQIPTLTAMLGRR